MEDCSTDLWLYEFRCARLAFCGCSQSINASGPQCSHRVIWDVACRDLSQALKRLFACTKGVATASRHGFWVTVSIRSLGCSMSCAATHGRCLPEGYTWIGNWVTKRQATTNWDTFDQSNVKRKRRGTVECRSWTPHEV